MEYELGTHLPASQSEVQTTDAEITEVFLTGQEGGELILYCNTLCVSARGSMTDAQIITKRPSCKSRMENKNFFVAHIFLH